MGRDSSVGIATIYGLGGPGIESRLVAKLSAFIQTGPGPTQLPVKWVASLFPEGQATGAWLSPPTPSST